MMNDIQRRLDAAYNEGVLYAVQAMASEALRHIRWREDLLNSDRAILNANIQTSAKRILRKRGLLPNPNDVAQGLVDDVELDFNMRI